MGRRGVRVSVTSVVIDSTRLGASEAQMSVYNFKVILEPDPDGGYVG